MSVIAAAVLVPVGYVAVGATPALAASSCHKDNQNPDPYDSGGRDATAWWQWESSCDSATWDLAAHFDAYDEVLTMRRNVNHQLTDIRANFNIYDSHGERLLDEDTFWFDGWMSDSVEPGYPDGQSDIDEGLVVKFRICGRVADGTLRCSAWAKGRA